jgi:predicted HicB family RNase H-like nuclease
MFKQREDGIRQIHLRVPEEVHTRLKVRAAIDNQSINELLTTRIISILIEGTGSNGEKVRL